jgi:ATP-binding cassette subfamily B protein RaxB
MFLYSAGLALLAVVALGLYAAIRAISFAVQRDSQQSVIVASAREQSTLIESLRGIVTLRLFNREATRHRQWQNRLVDSMNAGIRLARISIWQDTSNTLVFGLENILSIWLAIGFVISGGFSVGMVFAYVAYKSQFLGRAASLIDQGIAFGMLGLHLERLSDIALADQDVGCAQPALPRLPLKGRIELREIRYRYSPTDPFVLDGINLLVDAGEHIAITGPSGGGKSTLIKIILGLIEPHSGEVLIDGIPLKRFGYGNYREQAAAVLQEDHLFAGSIADNIALFNETPEVDQIAIAAKAAAIHDEIMQMPMGYETLVGDMGSSLSGGQKQRLLLARALYLRPKLLVIDEGTSHLDSLRESTVNTAISNLGATRVVVAHRFETIRLAQKIFVMSQGKLSMPTTKEASMVESL